MGNSKESNSSFRWEEQFEITQKNPLQRLTTLISRDTSEEYIGHEVMCSSEMEVRQIQNLIDKKLACPSEYVTRLQKFGCRTSQKICSDSQMFYMLFKKPYQTLKEESLNRKFQYQTFSEEEVEIILEAGVKGIKYLKHVGHPHGNISSSSIYIQEDRRILISDPWLTPLGTNTLLNANMNGYTYPSPQKILFQNDLIQEYDYFLSDLYSLGIILLQILHMEHMDILYDKGFRRILDQKVIHQLSSIRSSQLAKKITILLTHQPNKRLEIFKFYQRKTQPLKTFIKNQKEQFKKNYMKNLFDVSNVQRWEQQKKQMKKSTEETHGRSRSIIDKVIKEVNDKKSKKSSENTNFVFQSPLSNPLVRPYYPPDQSKMPKINFNNGPPSNQSPFQLIHQNKPYAFQPFESLNTTNFKNSSNYLSFEPFTFNQFSSVTKFTPINQKKQINNVELSVKNQQNLHSSLTTSQDLVNTSQNNFVNPSKTTFVNEIQKQPETQNTKKEVKELFSEGQVDQKKFQNLHNLIKEAQSINASSSNENSVVIERYTPTVNIQPRNTYSIGSIQNSSANKRQPDSRKSLPFYDKEHSFESNHSGDKITSKAMSDSSDKAIYESISNQAEVVREETPQRRPPKTRYNSTIKEVSEESPSADSYDHDLDERSIEYDIGTKYVGQLKNGKRNGQGTFYYEDGSYYSGRWKDNKMHGKGCLYYSSGLLAYEGDWYLDDFHGQGKIYNENPQPLSNDYDYHDFTNSENYWVMYDGSLFSDKKSGKGKLKLSNGEVYSGQFDDDKVHGVGKFYRLNGTIIHGKWVENILMSEFQK